MSNDTQLFLHLSVTKLSKLGTNLEVVWLHSFKRTLGNLKEYNSKHSSLSYTTFLNSIVPRPKELSVSKGKAENNNMSHLRLRHFSNQFNFIDVRINSNSKVNKTWIASLIP